MKYHMFNTTKEQPHTHWICQPVLWFTKSEFHFKCTNGPEQLLIRIMAHYIRKCASIITVSSLSWQTLENGPIKITLPVFSSLMSHNLQIISLSVCCIRWWRIRLDGSVLFMRLPTNQQSVAWSYLYLGMAELISLLSPLLIGSKLTLRLVRPLTAICRPVQGHLNYYVYEIYSSNYVQNAFWQSVWF